MINAIWEILTSIEIIILFVLLIILIIIIDPKIKFIKCLKRKKKNTIKESEKRKKKQIEDPGKIIVSDSTYEVLMEIKKKRR